jgi:hypothetical protein
VVLENGTSAIHLTGNDTRAKNLLGEKLQSALDCGGKLSATPLLVEPRNTQNTRKKTRFFGEIFRVVRVFRGSIPCPRESGVSPVPRPPPQSMTRPFGDAFS